MPLFRTKRSINHRLTFSLSLVIVGGAIIISGCNRGSTGNNLHVKTGATGEKDLDIKSGYAFAVTKTFTDINQNITTAVTYNVYAANYDLDAGNFAMTLDKPMISEDQVRVVLSLVGEEGTREGAPLKTGTYSAKADKYMKVENVGVVTRRGSADTKTLFDRSSLNGQVNVTSVTDDSFTGDIDLKAGETAIKGAFTAKVLKRK